MSRRALVLLLLFWPWITQADWPTFRGDGMNSGRSSVELSRSQSQSMLVPQAKQLGGLIWATPVIDADDNVYVGSSNKRFYSLDSRGVVRWSARIFDRPDALIDSAAALAPDNQVIVPGGDGDLHSLDRDTGSTRWTFHAYGASDSTHRSGEVVNSFEGNVQVGPNGWIYAGSDNGTLYCLDAQGKEQWHFNTGMMVWSSPAFALSGEWLAFGSLDGNLYLLDPKTGVLLASLNIGSDIKASVATDGKDRLYFGASDGRFRSVRVQKKSNHFDLRVEWSFSTEGEIYSSAALGESSVFFGSMGGQIYALGLDGKLLWRYATYSPVASSVLLTKDGKLLGGAANGKLYALDAVTGERDWSFQSSPATMRKSNLDSSPVLDSKGQVWVGSYQGLLHQVPGTYCRNHSEDSRCESGGKQDVPTFGLPSVPANGAYLRLENTKGGYEAANSRKIAPAEPLHLRFAAYENSDFVSNAAISVSGLTISAECDGVPLSSQDLQWSVSPDGKYLNVYPSSFFLPGSHYAVRVSGKYFHQSSWLLDRLKWFGLKKFQDRFEFEVEPGSGGRLLRMDHAGWAIRSFYLTQPKALDTYVPAALDGQLFLVKPFGMQKESRSFFLMVLPAVQVGDRIVSLPAPSRATVLEAQADQSSLRARGAFRMSAMGGVIPFDDVQLFSSLDDQSNLTGGDLRVVASCRQIQGNGDSYRFPWSLMNQVCDPYLNMIGHVVFSSDQLPPAPPTHLPISVISARGEDSVLEIESREPFSEGDHLLSAILYDSHAGKIEARQIQAFTALSGQSKVTLTLKSFARAAHKKASMILQVFVDDVPLDPVDLSRFVGI